MTFLPPDSIAERKRWKSPWRRLDNILLRICNFTSIVITVIVVTRGGIINGVSTAEQYSGEKTLEKSLEPPFYHMETFTLKQLRITTCIFPI